MKLISWNIDSLNAALTGTSERQIKPKSRVPLQTLSRKLCFAGNKAAKQWTYEKQLDILNSVLPQYEIVELFYRTGTQGLRRHHVFV